MAEGKEVNANRRVSGAGFQVQGAGYLLQLAEGSPQPPGHRCGELREASRMFPLEVRSGITAQEGPGPSLCLFGLQSRNSLVILFTADLFKHWGGFSDARGGKTLVLLLVGEHTSVL